MKLTRFAKFCWFVLGYNLFIIVWGAYVRASGSGAGCGSHWPLCNGEILPRDPGVQTLIELTHRVTSGLALLLVVGLVVWARRAYPRRHHVRWGAWLTLIFILIEALIGAGLVLLELVADNASLARAVYMAGHLANTFILLGVLTLTAWWASGGLPLRLKGTGLFGSLFAVAIAGTIILGISGAVAALGDTLFPASSLSEGLAQDHSPTAHILVRLRLLHPFIAVLVSAYLIFLAGMARRQRPSVWTGRFTTALIALIAAQLVIGVVNVLLLAPIWLQLVHLFMADLSWMALVLTANTVLQEELLPVQRLSHAAI